MARFDFYDEYQGLFQDDKTKYVVQRDDGSGYKTFYDRDEAQAYYNRLQQLDNQEKLVKSQQRMADELKRQNDIAEKRQREQERHPFPRPMYPPIDPEYLEWKREKAKKLAQEQAEKERRRREAEAREKGRLYNLAQEIDRGIKQIDSDWPSVQRIVSEDLYVFSDRSVILKIAERIPAIWFDKVIAQYGGNIPGIYDKLINNASFHNASNDTLKNLLSVNVKDKDYVCNFFAKLKNTNPWRGPWEGLDSATLKLLLSKNLVPTTSIDLVRDTVFSLDNGARVLNGTINDARDLLYAEQNYFGHKGFKFLLALAEKSSNKNALNHAYVNARGLTKAQTVKVYRALLQNPAYDNSFRHNVIASLIETEDTEQALLELKPYCNDSLYTKLLNRMYELGFISERQHKREINKRYPAKSDSKGGCAIWVVLIVIGAIVFFAVFV